MSIVDDVVAAVTPTESQGDRAEARSRARAAAAPGDWLDLILEHHLQLEAAFAAAASDGENRGSARKRLGVVLTGHAIAEESVVYPAMAQTGATGHSGHGYDEQALVKREMAELERLDLMSQDYLDKLETIREAVAHHMYEEEGTWFLDLKANASEADQAKITQRYKEEFDRYVGPKANAGAFTL
jgi:hypothetical protein